MSLRQIVSLCLLTQILIQQTSAQTIAENKDLRAISVEIIEHVRESELQSGLNLLGEVTETWDGNFEEKWQGLPAATGAVSRSLTQLDADEIYELLYPWTMPTQDRKNVRLLSMPVPYSAPPKVFAREIGERPRDETFQVSSINGVQGFFSTGWTLARAADELGRLSRVIDEVKKLAESGTASSSNLLTILQLYDARPPIDEIDARLNELIEKFSSEEESDQLIEIALNDIAIALAALKHESLQTSATTLLKAMEKATDLNSQTNARRVIRSLHASSVQISKGVSGPEFLYENRLKYWHPVSGLTAYHSTNGAPPVMWLTHENHIMHLTGPANDVLFFKYPLVGEFEFTCESQEGGQIGTDGGLVYNGLQFEALGRVSHVNIWDANLGSQIQKPNEFTRSEKTPTFNRISIRSKESEYSFMANLHPIYRQQTSQRPSPWLGLRSFSFRRPVFRNFKITREPEIPDHIDMLASNSLQGWRTDFFNESRPPFQDVKGTDYDWEIIDEELHAPKREQGGSLGTQSLIRYQRPLLDNETVTYEFFHQAGEFEVHPAFGRMAFLLGVRGIRVHWITDGPLEWTGLKQDNSTLEPLSRRGPRPFPLVEGDWNSMSLTRKNDKIFLTLNSELVYERDIDFEGDEQFGLFRFRTDSSVRIRKAHLTGDWQETLPEELYDAWEGFTTLKSN